jgi:hypothetical protein
LESKPADSTFNMRLLDMLVNSRDGTESQFWALKFTLIVFRSFFSKKPVALSGTPAVRRLKTYSAQSGYAYQYFYQGHRPFRSGGESGTEFVFSVSADRKSWHSTSVLLGDAAVQAWQAAHHRELSSTEHYAIAKMSLFQAFDDRPAPAQMQDEVRVPNGGLEAIMETLGLE